MPTPLSSRFLTHLRRTVLLRPGDRVAVAVSGGADSVALLRLLLEVCGELGLVLSVAHFNHKIRGEASDADEQFVRALAGHYGLDFHAGHGNVPAHSERARLSLEAAARELRYEFFQQLLEDAVVARIATAHTLDDQAETVLLKFLRGAWTQGLAGIYPRFASAKSKGEVVRPLLPFRRSELRDYLNALGQPWHEDASNLDLHHARNRVRQLLLPMIEREFNPAIAETLAGVAEIARAEQDYWDSAPPSKKPGEIGLDLLLRLPLAMRRRMVRTTAASLGLALDFRQTEQVLEMVNSEGPARLELPEGWLVERVFQPVNLPAVEAPQSRRVLRFFRMPCDAAQARAGDPCHSERSEESLSSPAAKGIPHFVRNDNDKGGYEYRLSIPGEVFIPELAATIRASIAEPPAQEEEEEANALDPEALGHEIVIRNWRPGDRFWPAHTSGPKKVKELLQGRHITGSQRARWPVALAQSEIVWLHGFRIPEHWRARGRGVRIELAEEPQKD